ncbi:unnamed protein product [Polarella glacialis]|uniref:SURP motif domain-containing protein n=1 Tax=Polarella glacialis TaxID=89957 RepID=A0A813I1G7_POLGL|nr:unnamed protein product [Polarella glacialis]
MLAAMAAALAPDLRKRIEIMADHIARNGVDFESTVKQKNASNPQFAFLYSGEGSEYYQQVLFAHRTPVVPPPAPVPAPVPAQVPIPAYAASGGSLATLLRGGQVEVFPSSAAAPVAAPPSAPVMMDVAVSQEVLRRWKEPQVLALTPEVERQLAGVLGSLESMASRDAIRNGRLWIECNSALGPHIAGHVMRRVVFLSICAHRLHVLYLVHDVLQTEAARKEAQQPLIRAFKPFLPWILRPCYQLALSQGGEDVNRVLRLLQLWVDRLIVSTQEAKEIKAIASVLELPSLAAVPVPAQSSSAPRPGFQGNSTPSGIPPSGMTMRGSAAPNFGWPLGAGGLASQVLGLAGLPARTLQGYRPQMLGARGGPQTPETVPVGVLATMLVQLSKTIKKLDFIRYKPLDPALTPQMLPPTEPPAPRLLQRVEDFYEDLKDEERQPSSSRSRSRSRSKNSSRSSRSAKSRRDRSRSRDGQRAQPGGFGGFGGPAAGMNAVPPPLD